MESLEQIAQELLTVLLVVAAETRGEPVQFCFTSLTALYITKIINVCEEIDKLEIFENTKNCISPYGRDLQKYLWNKAIFCKIIFGGRLLQS